MPSLPVGCSKSSTMRNIFTILLLACSAIVVHAQDYSVDANGNIVVSRTVEGLAGASSDLYAAAKKYLEESYRVTRYKIIVDAPDQGTVMGEGTFLNFYRVTILLNSYTLSAEFTLRIDAKEGRARITLSAHNYTGTRQNNNKTEELCDAIADYAPVNTINEEKKKLYTKAFPVLVECMTSTVDEVEATLREVAGAATLDSDW